MIVILTAAILLAFTASASAGPLIGALVLAAGITGFAGQIVTAVGTLALTLGASLVASKLFQQDVPLEAATVGGSQLDLRAAPDVPRSIIFGRAVTAGSLVYANTFGKVGVAENGRMVEIIALADHVVDGFEDVFCEGKKAVLIPDAGRFLIDGFNDRVELLFHDGSQNSADAFTVANLSTASQPWTEDMVGVDVAYLRVHLRYDTKHSLVTGPLEFKFVVRGIKLYDPRKDTTVGGSGSHRWGNENTYEWSNNPALIIYNILRGIYVSGNFLYGLENASEDQFPLDVWFAAMNACDVTFSTSGGDMARYSAGAEVTVDTPPLDVINELLKTCGGRLVEIGGIYKIYLDAPDLPVLSFTDDDLVASMDASFKPVLGIDNRINYVTGTYTSPNKWTPIEAAPRSDADREALDGRRLPAHFQSEMVQNRYQMQRLMKQLLKRAQQERKHKITLSPAAFGVEPGQTVSWDSDQNGYTDKLFVVDQVQIEPNLCVTLALTEINANDYNWETGDELVEVDGDLVSTVPPAKVIEGFNATGVTVGGDIGTKKPGILLTWNDPEDGDVEFVRYQLRRAADPSNIINGPPLQVSDLLAVITGGLAPLTNYEISARFLSSEGYITDWSLWIPVTTPDVRISIQEFDDALQAIVLQATSGGEEQIREAEERLAALIAQVQSAVDLNKVEATQSLERATDQLSASFTEEIEAATGAGSALSQLVTTLQASVGALQSGIKASYIVGSTPSGAIAAYELTTTVQSARSGLRVAVYSDGAGGFTGHVLIDSDKFFVGKTGDNATFKPIFIVDTANNRVVLDGSIIASGSIKASSLDIGFLSAISANLGEVNAGRAIFTKKVDGVIVGQLEISSNPVRILISDNS